MKNEDLLKEQFSKLTVEYITKDNLPHRKSLGQYFTPKSIIKELLKKIPNIKPGMKILDPACGTGEFLIEAKKYFKNPKLYGWEIDPELKKISEINIPSAKITKTDTLTKDDDEKFDIIIGNPPYFEFIPSNNIKQKYSEVINGRINIFSLFIYKGIKSLKDGGYLAYVVPPSKNNGAYFSKLRNYIINNTNIKYVKILNDSKLFDKALQTVMLLVLKKEEHKNKYVFTKNNISIITENKKRIEKIFNTKTTLHELGYKVKTGRIVWNQNKDLLTDIKDSETIPLVWAHNITAEGLKIPFKKNKKPQYIKSNNFDIGPAIVVNRIIGSVNNGKIRSAIIPKGMKFLAENHTNVIYMPKQETLLADKKSLSIKEINKQINSIKNLEILKSITGNTQISKNELEKLFPLELI